MNLMCCRQWHWCIYNSDVDIYYEYYIL